MTAIDSDQNTMVIEIRAGKGMFTEAAPLSSEALLKECGQCAGLTDSVGGGTRARLNKEARKRGRSLKRLKAIRPEGKRRRVP